MLVLLRPISLTHNPEPWISQKQSYFTPAATSDPQTGKKKIITACIWHFRSFRGSDHYQNWIFSNLFFMHLLAQWIDKLNIVYEKLVDGKPRYQSTKLWILRYYIKFHVFTGVLIYPQKNHSIFLEAKDAVLSFWQCLSLCWAQNKCLINTCQSADGMFKYLPLSSFMS